MAARSAIDELASVEQEMVILRHQKTLLARTRGEPGSGAAADSRMDPLARQRNSGGSAGTASGPPADDISVDPARKGLVSVFCRDVLLLCLTHCEADKTYTAHYANRLSRRR